MTRSTTPMRERDREREKSKERGKKRDKKEDIGPPGAGTLWVYDVEAEEQRTNRRSRPLSRGKGASKERETEISRMEVGKSWEEYAKMTHDPISSTSPDSLLERGIEAYRFIPASRGGVLGRGKFSTVYKVLDLEGKEFALKHTPLHPHHPLIAARLLREPTLLAQLPAHPCLIGVHGTIQTSGHFYLLETYAKSHIPLSTHPTPILPSRAAYILDQLVSVTRDCLHSGGRVVHRDLKGDNVLIDIETGDLLVLDLGLATHYSASEPKLTTCCGSPAFHSPEIVNALNYPPGVVTYYGPELDIWCIALTVLSLLLDIRYPLGPSHKSLHIMRERTLDRLQELDELYPPSSPFRHHPAATSLSETEREHEVAEWKRVRRGLWKFLVIDGNERMAGFAAYELGPNIAARVAEHQYRESERGFKTLSFAQTDMKHTLPIYLDAANNDGKIVLHNPTGLSERRILSYIKYILRSRGVLYHCVAVPSWSGHGEAYTSLKGGWNGEKEEEEDRTIIAQLVLPYHSPMSGYLASIPKHDDKKEVSWVSSLIASAAPTKRASSVPPLATRPSITAIDKGEKQGSGYYLKCWARIDIEHLSQAAAIQPQTSRPVYSRSSSRRSSGEHSNASHGSVPTISTAPTSPVISSTMASPTHTPIQPISPIMGLNPVLPLSPLTTLQEGVPARPTSPARAHSVDGLGKALRNLQKNQNGRTGLGAGARNMSTSRIPSTRRPHPLSRQVSYETSSRIIVPSKITITLSDERGYAVLREILDVKHDCSGSPTLSHGSANTGGTVTAVGSTASVNTVHTKAGPVLEPIPRRGPYPEPNGDIEVEESRGRPRSKDEPKVLILERPPPTVSPKSPKGSKQAKQAKQSKQAKLSPRGSSRGRTKGFLENWFGAREEGMRSSSSPPVRTRFEVGAQT